MNKRVWERRVLAFILILIITIPAVISLLRTTYFPIHDDQSVARLYLLHKGLTQGTLYPRWVDELGFGFGYPLFNFYPPLVYYVAEGFHLLGLSFIWSIKATIILGFMVGGVGMWRLSRHFVGEKASYLAVALYTYFSYHAVLTYVRGALAELFAYSLLPFVFLAIVNLGKKLSLQASILWGLMLGALILTHPLIAAPAMFFVAAFLLFYYVISKNNRYAFLKLSLIGIAIGIFLSAFFWLPSLAEKKYTLTDKILTSELASYKIHYIYPQQFWYSPWGYGGSIAGPYDGMSYQLGKIHITLAVLAIALGSLAILSKKVPRQTSRSFLLLTLLLFFSLFMTTSYSAFVWDSLGFLWFLQFPWRFLTFTGIFISLVAASLVQFSGALSRKASRPLIQGGLVIALSLILIFQYQKYFKPQRDLVLTDAQKTSYEEIAWNVSRSSFEFIPRGVLTTKSELNTTIPAIGKNDISKSSFSIHGNARVEVLEDNFRQKKFSLSADEPTQFRLNTFYFPGWGAKLDGKETQVSDNNKYKLMTVSVPAGEHTLTFTFQDTLARKAANTISLLAVLLVLLLIVGGYLRRSEEGTI